MFRAPPCPHNQHIASEFFYKGALPTNKASAPGFHDTETTLAEHPTTAREATGHTERERETFTYTPSHHFTTQLTTNHIDEGLKILSDGLDDLEVDLDLEYEYEFDLNDDDAQNIDEVTDMIMSLDEEEHAHKHAHKQSDTAPLLSKSSGRFTLTFPANGIACLTNLAHIAVPAPPPQPQAPLALFKQLQSSIMTEPCEVCPQVPKPRKTGSKARHDSNAWTDLETDCLRRGISLFGTQKHKWSLIKQHFQMELHGRSNVDLKDRWRNLQGRKQNRKRKGNKCEQMAQIKKCKVDK